MPYAEACAPLTQPFRPRCLSSNFSTELTHCLRGACATLTPLRRKNEKAYAMLARCLRDLPPAMFSKCAQIFCLRGNFPQRHACSFLRAAYAMLAFCLRRTTCTAFFKICHVCIYIYIYVCIYTYTYIYVYINM